MAIKDRILDWLGAVPAAEMDDLRSRAYEAGFYDGGNDDPATGTFKKGGQGYKRLSDDYIREGTIDFQLAMKTAWELWQKSLIAKRVLTIKRDHIIGHNAAPGCTDPDVLEVVQSFWDGNKLTKRGSEFTIQLFRYGEQCFPAYVRESDGRVRLGYIDPQNIKEVPKHPDNNMEDWAVVVEKPGPPKETLVFRIIRKDESYVDEEQAIDAQYEGKHVTWEQATLEPWEVGLLDKHGLTEYNGSCFYTKVNADSNQARGMSDLLQGADWMDQDDEVLFSLAERENMAGFFFFDVMHRGADKTKIREEMKEWGQVGATRGGAYHHNENQEVNVFAPDLGQTGSIETFRAILGYILGGMGYPVHWYGFGDDANRATALAQGDPTAKTLEHDQSIIKDMFLEMIQFAIDQAEIAGVLTGYDAEYEVTLNLPEISSKDMSRISASLSQVIQSLAVAEDRGYMSHETAVKIWAQVVGELDVEINPASEIEMIEQEQGEAALDQESRRNNALNAALNGGGQQPGQNGQSGRPVTMADIMQMLGE